MQCCTYGNLIIALIPPDLNQVLNFMHWPCGTINSIRLSVCKQPDRLGAELRHGNEGLKDDRTAETSQREPKSKSGHLGLTAAQPSSLLQYSFCFWGALQVSNLGLMGKKGDGTGRKRTGIKWAYKSHGHHLIGVAWNLEKIFAEQFIWPLCVKYFTKKLSASGFLPVRQLGEYYPKLLCWRMASLQPAWI